MNPDTPLMNRRRLLCGCAGLATLSLLGCGQRGDATSSAPAEIDAQSSCSLDGMQLSDYPGPKGQIRYAGVAEVQWFCDSVELLSVLLARILDGASHDDCCAWVADWVRDNPSFAFQPYPGLPTRVACHFAGPRPDEKWLETPQ